VTKYVQEHNIPPENIHIADDIGMWSGSVAIRTRVNPATMDRGGRREEDDQRGTEIVALSAAGGIDVQFLKHRKQIAPKVDSRTVVIEKGISGTGTEQMLDWSKGFLECHRSDGNSVLMLDRHGAHRNKKVIETLEAGGFIFSSFICSIEARLSL
jgi:hypothetical protein